MEKKYFEESAPCFVWLSSVYFDYHLVHFFYTKGHNLSASGLFQSLCLKHHLLSSTSPSDQVIVATPSTGDIPGPLSFIPFFRSLV